VDNFPKIKEANIFYLLVMIVFLTVGSSVQYKSLYGGLLITEFILIMLPVLMYLKIRNYDFKSVLKLNSFKPVHILIVFGIMFFGWYVSAFLGILTNYVLTRLVPELPPFPIAPAMDFKDLIMQIMVIGVSAAIAEEIMFRGLILKSYEEAGTIRAVIFSGFLFGMMHLNPQNLLSTSFLGMLIALIVVRTNSIFMGMVAHFINNTIAVTLLYLSSGLGEVLPDESASTIIGFKEVAVWFLIALFMSAFLIVMIKSLYKNTSAEPVEPKGDAVSFLKKSLFHWPILIAMTIYVLWGLYQLGII